MKIYFLNTGCSLETEAFIRVLRLARAEETHDITKADIIIAHFCGLSTESFQTIPPHMAVLEGVKQFNPKVKIYVGGCASGVVDLKKRYPFVDGVFLRSTMIRDLAPYLAYNPESDEDEPTNIYNAVTIQRGCLRSCGFCKKAYMNMELKSKPIEKVIRDVKHAVSKGYHDIILLAENATEYGLDLPEEVRLIDLLKEVVRIDGVEALSVTALCIDELALNQELVDYIKNCKKIHKVQLEIQSLIPDVRKNMRLTSTVEDVLRILKEFSNKYIITNIMCGYPGETDGNFKNQLELIEKENLYYLQVNIYDNTPLVYGHSLKQIPKDVVAKRLPMLIEVLSKIRRQKAIKLASEESPTECIYTTVGKFELVGHSAVVDIGNAKKCIPGQTFLVKINGIKKVFDMYDRDQTMILGGKLL